MLVAAPAPEEDRLTHQVTPRPPALGRRLPVQLLGGAALVFAATAPTGARACMNAVVETDETVAAMKKAERILDEGDPEDARGRVEALRGDLASLERKGTATAPGLRDRATRILALADVRIEGAGHDAAARRAVLGRAVAKLERIAEDSPKDAAKQTDLGEALAGIRPDEAGEILEDLAGRDVVTTPYGYAALARLRAAAGDAKGRDEALARCRPMTKVPAICLLEPLPASRSLALPAGALLGVLVVLGEVLRRALGATRRVIG
jgi:hypothetical protein